MIRSSNYKPTVLQTYAVGARQNIDRLTGMSVGSALNRTPRKELGTTAVVGYRKGRPEVGLSLTQAEYGEIDFYQAIANSSEVTLEETDFYTSAVDVLVYLTDDDGTFLGTKWYEKARVAGFDINISSPEDDVERSFSLVGNENLTLYNNNKYVIELIDTAGSGVSGSYDIIIGSGDYSTYPDPVVDPNNSGVYIERIIRIRSGAETELVEGTDFTYTSGSTTINIIAGLADDVFKVIYSAATYISGAVPFTSNTVDLSGLNADSVSVYLTDNTNYMYKLQSVSVSVALNRFDAGEVGNKEIVQRGVTSADITVTLPRNVEDFVLDENLLGVTTGHGKVDIREYSETAILIIKFYSSNTKATFKYGIRCENLTVGNVDDNATVDAYTTQSNSLVGTTIVLSTTESVINDGV